MSGARVTITVDDAAVRAQLERLLARVQHPTDALREVGEVLQQSTQRRFATETAPDGTHWAPNSPVTLARKTSRHILTDSGLLGDTIHYQLTADRQGVAVGSNRVYAAMQQFGGTTAQHPQLWGDIPARQFLGLSATDRTTILDIFTDYLGSA